MAHSSTPQQIAYYTAGTDLRGGSIALRALAGTGKTTSQTELARQLPGSGLATSVLRSTTADLAKAMPTNWITIGLHSLGWRAIRKKLPGAKLDKSGSALYEFCKNALKDEDNWWKLFADIKPLVEQAMLAGIVPNHERFALEDTEDNWLAITERFDLDWSPLIYKTAHAALTHINKLALDGTAIQFSHMLTLPLFWSFPVEQFPKIIVDEAQDLNILQHLMIQKALRHNGRVFVTGDPNQAIMAFAGSDSNSFYNLVDRFNCQVLPLTWCWRCGSEIIDVARQYVPELEAPPGAHTGAVTQVEPTDLAGLPRQIICRNNAPLTALAMRLFASGFSVECAGRDIGAGLKSTINRVASAKTSDYMKSDELAERLRRWADREIERHPARKHSILDKLAAISALASVHSSVGAIRKHIDNLYVNAEDDKRQRRPAEFQLSTIHKCLAPDTLVETTKGVQPIANLPPEGQIQTSEGIKPYTNKVAYKDVPTYKLTLEGGYTLEVSHNHHCLVWQKESFTLFPAHQLKTGHIMRLPLYREEPICVEAPPLPLPPTVQDPREIIHKIPSLSPAFATFLGIMVADGTLFDRGFRYTKQNVRAVQKFADLIKDLFDYTCEVCPTSNSLAFECSINSTYLARWLQQIEGIQPNAKQIPPQILAAPINIQAAFLSGLFEDSGINQKGLKLDHIAWSQTNSQMAKEVQLLLLRQGIVSRRFLSAHGLWRIDISGAFALDFAESVGFFCPDKQELALSLEIPSSYYIVPFSHSEAAYLPTSPRQNARSRGTISRSQLHRHGDPYNKLRFHYARVINIQESVADVYCIEVPSTGTFLQFGIDGGNSKGREWDRVGFLDPHLIPARWAKQPWEREQETNLLYVATTRAKNELIYLNSDMIQ